jgi:hypothetical protein
VKLQRPARTNRGVQRMQFGWLCVLRVKIISIMTGYRGFYVRCIMIYIKSDCLRARARLFHTIFSIARRRSKYENKKQQNGFSTPDNHTEM